MWLGKLLDYDYARTAKAHGFSTDKKQNYGLEDFPIERARLQSSLYLVGIATASTIGYGWAVKFHVVSLKCSTPFPRQTPPNIETSTSPSP